MPLLIVLAGLAPAAPLGHIGYALGGVVISAFASWLALTAWRHSGLPPFRARHPDRNQQGSDPI